MTDLIACLSSGKGTWAQLYRIIEKEEWNNIFLITNDFGKEKYNPKKNEKLIVIDTMKDTDSLVEEIITGLKPLVRSTEVAINLSSGTGKEHMALISAVLRLGVGLRLVDLVGEKVREI